MDATDLTFRPATSADLPALHALIEGAYRGETARVGWSHEADLIAGPRTSIKALAAAIAAPEELLVVASHGLTIIGCFQLARLSATTSYLGLLTIDPQRQTGGLGRHLIAVAEAEAARQFGSTMMELSVVSQRRELIAYYQRRGYILTGEQRPFPIPLEPPLFLVVLEKPLLGTAC